MKTVLVEPLTIGAETLERLSQPLRADGHTFVAYDKKPANTEEWKERIQDAEQVILANTPLPAEALDAAKELKYINVAFTGTDHVPVDAATERDIIVTNAAGYSDQGVAEHVIGLTLSLLRSIPVANDATRHGGRTADFLGQEIAGKTVGIIGTGHIGGRVFELFQAFGATCLGVNRSEKAHLVEQGLTYVPLEECLRRADILTIHLPSTPQTRHYLGAAAFRQMKKSAIIINCARGPIVDNEALAEALRQGEIAGAGIDVFDTEPPLTDSPLLDVPHTILTPHIAYFTEEAMEKRATRVFQNAARFMRGEEVENRVN